MCFATLYEVNESARCGHYNLRTVAQGAYLLTDAGASIYGNHVDSLDKLREVTQVISYLQA